VQSVAGLTESACTKDLFKESGQRGYRIGYKDNDGDSTHFQKITESRDRCEPAWVWDCWRSLPSFGLKCLKRYY